LCDRNPRRQSHHYGHALVIPKNHHRDFLEVPENELPASCTPSTLYLMHWSRAQLKGFNFFRNNGAVAGQSVFHFHIHITPRYEGDNIKFVLQLKRYEGSDMNEVASKIRSAIHE